MNVHVRLTIALAAALPLLLSPTSAADGTAVHALVPEVALGSAEVRNAGYGAAIQVGPCTLYPTVIHFRKKPPSGIGPKPYTDCKGVRVTSIRQETRLEYEWYAWWKLALVVSGGNTGESRYTQRKVDFKCVNSTSTVWGATTVGTVVYQSKTYYARVYQKMRRLPCGA